MSHLYLGISALAGIVVALAFFRGLKQGGAGRRMLLVVGLWSIGPLLLVCGGAVLSWFGLAWRSMPREILIWWSLLGAFPAVLSVGQCTEDRERRGARSPHAWVIVLCMAVLLVDLVVLCGMKVFLLSRERDFLQEWQGQTVVVRDRPILIDSHLTAFSYHGPLVRGNEILWEYRTS